jgi:ABC-type antimicrobial peptide transport system permease subunit
VCAWRSVRHRSVAESVGAHMRVVTAGAVVGWMVVFVGVMALVPAAVSGIGAFIGVPVLMLVVAGIACWIPSRLCAGVDPVISLRSE